MTVEAVQSRSGIGARAAVIAYIVVSGLVLLLMMLLGLTMRLAPPSALRSAPRSALHSAPRLAWLSTLHSEDRSSNLAGACMARQ